MQHAQVTNTLNRLWSEDTKASIVLVKKFKKKLTEEKDMVRQDPHSQTSFDRINKLQDANQKLKDNLMLIEANAQEIFNNVMRVFEIAYGYVCVSMTLSMVLDATRMRNGQMPPRH